MSINDNIVLDNEIRFGEPTIKGTRISVSDILNYISGGDTVETLIENFPELNRDKINSALQYASSLVSVISYPVYYNRYENVAG